MPASGAHHDRGRQAGRSGYFKAQQKALGELNGHVEEMFTGHAVVKAFGREKASIERFIEINDELYEAGWKAQFISGLIMPMLGFISNFGYLMVSVAGRPARHPAG